MRASRILPSVVFMFYFFSVFFLDSLLLKSIYLIPWSINNNTHAEVAHFQ